MSVYCVNLSGLLALAEYLPQWPRLLGAVRGGGRVRLGTLQAAQAYIVAALRRELAATVLVVTGEAGRAHRLSEELAAWSGDEGAVAVFAEADALPYERISWDSATRLQRLNALVKLSGGSPVIVVTSARALASRLADPAAFKANITSLRRGQRIRPVGARLIAPLLARWLGQGYAPETVVMEPGTFSRRGGIIDVWPVNAESPVRIELFGDEIDSLRYFDPATQRSLSASGVRSADGPADEVIVPPARELLASEGPKAFERLRELDLSGLEEETREDWERDLGHLERGEAFDGLEFYAAYLDSATLLDYLPEGALVVLDDPDGIARALQELETQAEELRGQLVGRGELPEGFAAPSTSGGRRLGPPSSGRGAINRAPTENLPYWRWQELERRLDAEKRRLDFVMEVDEWGELAESIAPVEAYGGKVKAVLEEARSALQRKGETQSFQGKEGGRVVIVSQQVGRLAELAADQAMVPVVAEELNELVPPGSFTLLKGSLSGGFALKGAGLILLTDSEIFGWAKPRRVVRRRPVPRATFLSELAVGDYAVHVEHGIARFLGLVRMHPSPSDERGRMQSDGAEREYAALEYAEGDKLYVPVDQADRISRYVGPGEGQPAMHRLGTGDWTRAKSRAKAAAKDVAKDLLAIYSAREAKPGYAFSQDTVWQGELEAAFPYVETADQLQVADEVKSDMERPKPMDRLVVGDVGYGKTEIALRAAFKAVMDGKQVAVLVPTTVLAQQHFETFRQRIQAFPVRVEMLSRFRSPKEQKAVLGAIKAGTVDICIGTHRLVQKDVEFKDLGLVIIDEEQRFGVMQKERLRQLRKEVDVLTMSATPIPRTLYMALASVRDMSTLETPPEDRLPIKTYVVKPNEDLLREVILRELDRGGQAFFVHNRVQSIAHVAKRLMELVPEAHFAMGHGQMPEDKLEKVMADFAAGKYDVLVCSTIIESGLDIPNVNTIIVDRADHFGLAQLYQLRGRVGRGANRAYAYFVVPKGKRLTPQAEKRLRAIFEATELGAGFRIAQKDLEIRGAGNLLGSEQHGHVAAVGLDLYSRLLAEAVRELQGKPVEVRLPEVKVDLPVSAFIPKDYVEDEPSRLNLYQRLAAAASEEEVGRVVQEMQDRFGPQPQEVLNLVELVRLKLLAARARAKALFSQDGDIVISFPSEINLKPDQVRRLGPLLRTGYCQLRFSRRQAGARWMEVLRGTLERLGEQHPAAPATRHVL